MTEPAEKREVRGLIFRGFRAELDRRGLTQQVLARLQGEARDALEHPPLHSTWMPAPVFDEIIVATGRETNRQTVREVGHSVVKGTTGPLTLPLIKTFLNLFGASPPSLLNNLGRLSALSMRGAHHTYEPETPRSGVVTISHAERVDPLLFALWEGVFIFGQDIFGFPMGVETAVLRPDGRSARIRVSWPGR